jgi:hypothetical protein
VNKEILVNRLEALSARFNELRSDHREKLDTLEHELDELTKEVEGLHDEEESLKDKINEASGWGMYLLEEALKLIEAKVPDAAVPLTEENDLCLEIRKKLEESPPEAP